MSTITSSYIRHKLTDVWPGIKKNIWLRNRRFISLKHEEITDLIESIDLIEGGECEDYTTMLHGEARKNRLEGGFKLPWAIGECLVKEFMGIQVPHALNIAVCDEGDVLLIEPQLGAVWVADKKLDDVYFVWI